MGHLVLEGAPWCVGMQSGAWKSERDPRVDLEVSTTWGPDGDGQSSWAWLRKPARVLGAVTGDGALGPSRQIRWG